MRLYYLAILFCFTLYMGTPYMIFGIGLTIFLCFVLCMFAIKVGQKEWKFLIPVYNQFTLAKVAGFGNGYAIYYATFTRILSVICALNFYQWFFDTPCNTIGCASILIIFLIILGGLFIIDRINTIPVMLRICKNFGKDYMVLLAIISPILTLFFLSFSKNPYHINTGNNYINTINNIEGSNSKDRTLFDDIKEGIKKRRWGTLRFALALLLIFVINDLLILLGNKYDINILKGDFIMYIFYLAQICISIKRFHDLGYSGWLSLLSVIPLVPLILCFVRGEKGDNKYGPADIISNRNKTIIRVLILALLIFYGYFLYLDFHEMYLLFRSV